MKEMQLTLNKMDDLEEVISLAINGETSVGLFIEMPGFPKPELITNPCENLSKKLEYYKATYDDNLEHKYAKGIKIVGYTY